MLTLSPTCYLPFFFKLSKSIHRVAQRIALRQVTNGLANFLNKTAVLSAQRATLSPTCYLPFYLKVRKSFHRVAQRVALCHLTNGLANFLNKTAVLSPQPAICRFI